MHRITTQKGFTMIEILVAIFVIVVALMGILTVASMVIGGNTYSRDFTTAITLTQETLEELKNDGYDNVTGGTESSSIFMTTWSVTDDTPEADMKTVTATTTWSRKGQSHTVTLRTIMGDLGY